MDNADLDRRYCALKETMKERNQDRNIKAKIERWLWHGTSMDNIEQICRQGFNRSYCRRATSKYGKGVYFSTSFSYSQKFSPADNTGFCTALLCRVLVGSYAKGDAGMMEPPMLNPADMERYDSCVDNVNNPTKFVVFQDAQAYPEYVLTFNMLA